MSGIQPTSGVASPLLSSTTGSAARKPAAEQGGFGQLLQNYIGQVNKDQQASVQAIHDLMAGKTQDILPVVSAVAKADLSFKLLMGVRNKVIEAYKQTLNMQV